MDNQSFLDLLAKLMPESTIHEDNLELDLDGKFNSIFTHIEEKIAPIILNSPCIDKAEIVQELRQTVRNYQVLSKLPEIIASHITFRYSGKCAFNAINLYCHAPEKAVWCINTFGHRVKLNPSELKIIRKHEDYSVPIKAFIYANPDHAEDEITVFCSNSAEFSEAVQYFAAHKVENINLKNEINAILQRAFQYFETVKKYSEDKLGLLNTDVINTDDPSSKKLLKRALKDVAETINGVDTSLSELKKQFEAIKPELKTLRMDLLRLSDCRIPEDTPEQIIETPCYDFSLEPFDKYSSADLGAITNGKLKRNILANLGDLSAVESVASSTTMACFPRSSYSRDPEEWQIEQAKQALKLWEYLENNGELTSKNAEDIAKLYKLLGDGGKVSSYKKALKYAKQADTGYANFMIGKMHEFMNGDSTTLNDLRTAKSYYLKAESLGYDFAQKSLDRVSGKIEQREALQERSYNSSRSYSPHSSSYSDGGCFITTAVCQFLGKPDDCYELTVFRSVRDTWMMNHSEGPSKIEEYYAIAPKIVSAINSLPNRDEIYANIWKTSLKPCLTAIERGDYEWCVDVYKNMVADLCEKYCLGAVCE